MSFVLGGDAILRGEFCQVGKWIPSEVYTELAHVACQREPPEYVHSSLFSLNSIAFEILDRQASAD